jgi:rubredoxin
MAAKNQAKCEDCGEPIDITAPGVAQHVTGWAVNRSGGGTNAIAFRQVDLRWLCRWCVDRRKAGRPLEQGSLFK